MNDPITAIIAELESSHETDNIGMFTIRTANRTIAEAAMRPNPRQLYQELWYEGEVCCLFSDSNLGKSIYAVQMPANSQTNNSRCATPTLIPE